MKFEPHSFRSHAAWGFMLCAVLLTGQVNAQTPPLSSWNDGPAKQSIIAFVKKVTDRSDTNSVKPEDRVATFDRDGTLWVEYPLYTQGAFAFDRVRKLGPKHPEWNRREPFKAVVAGDRAAMVKFSEADWEIVVAATYTGMITEAFIEIVKHWLASAEDTRIKRPYTELAYRPMLEVMDYLRNNGFKTYIVTGGGQEFVRVYSQLVYDVPPEEVVGSSVLTKYEYRDGKPVLMREPKVFFIDDHAGKPIGINLFIGKRPCAAFGNSTGDQQMLEWTQAGGGTRLMMLVLHDDSEREYAYGPARGLPDTKGWHLLRFADGRSQQVGLGDYQYEERLETHFRVREVT